MQQSENRARVLGRQLARPLNGREVAMVSGAGQPYEKGLLNCESCITCVGGKVDIALDGESGS
ncbi:MAG: hypothetical protein KatS3mg119_1970 [Rhodothalassiaceae bacterium]|nr:MAG: hypothetical protein KatS3mg119_1970 [Rhodothalassiaceae bacterium]